MTVSQFLTACDGNVLVTFADSDGSTVLKCTASSVGAVSSTVAAYTVSSFAITSKAEIAAIVATS